MPSVTQADTLTHINQLAARQYALRRELERLAADSVGDWHEVSAPALDELRHIEGQLWQAWEQWRHERAVEIG